MKNKFIDDVNADLGVVSVVTLQTGLDVASLDVGDAAMLCWSITGEQHPHHHPQQRHPTCKSETVT